MKHAFLLLSLVLFLIVPSDARQKGLSSVVVVSDASSEDLSKWGFKFRGSTICYAFMQAVGIVDDHLMGCFGKRRK